MEEQMLDTLIDQYLLGTISPGDLSRLKELMATDPAVAGMVKESERAYKALLLERNRLLKEKLRQLDKDGQHEQRFMSGKTSLVFFIVSALMLAYTLLALYHQPKSIARRNLAAFPEHLHLSVSPDQSRTDWQLAEEAFLADDFQRAIQRYVVMAGDTGTAGHDEARWNILMAQLAAEGPSAAWQIAMEAYAHEAPEALSARANKVAGMFKTTYYKLFFSSWKEKLSCLKPRLI